MDRESERRLVEQARLYRERARCDYSGFAVGAALETVGGKAYGGCNVENATYGLTVCAERVALWKALSEGEKAFSAIAVVTDAGSPTPPCGPCRQLLWEYCGDMEVILETLSGERKKFRLSELLPEPFEFKK